MSRKNKKTRKQNRGKGRATQGPGGRTTKRMLHSVYVEPSRFPRLPEELQVSLVYVKNEDRTAGQTTPWNMVQPLCEFNTNMPRFAPELYQIYRLARIMRIDVSMTILNTSATEPIYTTMAILPYVDASVSTLTPQSVADFPKARVFMTGPINGIDRTHVRGSFPVETLLGEQNVGRSFLQDYSEAITSGVLGDLPAIYIGNLAAKIGNTWAGQFEIRFTMHIRFSELNYPSLGSARIRKPLPPPSRPKFKKSQREGDMHYESYDGYDEERSQTSWDEQPKLQRPLKESQNRSNSEIREKDGTAGAMTFIKVARR